MRGGKISPKTEFKTGQSGNPNGRPKGAISRSTIARKVLAMAANYPDHIFEKLKEQYPAITKKTTIEEMMTMVMADKAIRKGSESAYDKLLDSAYGRAKTEVDLTSGGETFRPATVIIQVDGK